MRLSNTHSHIFRIDLSRLCARRQAQGRTIFQKHEGRSNIPGITKLSPDLHPGHPPLLVVDTKEALAGLRLSWTWTVPIGSSVTSTLIQRFRGK
jgi:hypothetical protein